MPKKTKKQKILAAYRRKIKLLENQSFEKKITSNNNKNDSHKLKVANNHLTIDLKINSNSASEISQNQIVKKFFIKDFIKSLILIILIIGLIIGLYLIKIT